MGNNLKEMEYKAKHHMKSAQRAALTRVCADDAVCPGRRSRGGAAAAAAQGAGGDNAVSSTCCGDLCKCTCWNAKGSTNA